MTQTFLFEELDEQTRQYLLIVRDSHGKGLPGILETSPSSFAGCSLLAGLIIVPLTLMLTLTDWLGIVYQEPMGVALLQTAGLVLGGWLLAAFIRLHRPSEKRAGNWVYLDALNVYVANQEFVRVTSLRNAVEAKTVPNRTKDGRYQNSRVSIKLGDGTGTSFIILNEYLAEQIVAFVNYLVWARGPEGHAALNLTPAQLGALARHVSRHDTEPRNALGQLDLEVLDLNPNLGEIPDEPRREGRATPAILPYVCILSSAVLIFAVMAFTVNPVMRDNALFDFVMMRPTEPRVLRHDYLLDSRNSLHRDEVLTELSNKYDRVIAYVQRSAQQPDLQRAMVTLLTDLSHESKVPLLSLRVTERSPVAIAGGAPARVKKLRESIVGGDELSGVNHEGILDQFARISPAVVPEPGMEFAKPPPPIGYQLVVFVEPPMEAAHAHLEIAYELKAAGGNDRYQLSVTIEARQTVDGDPIATFSQEMGSVPGDDASLTKALDLLRASAIRWLVGDRDPNAPNIP